MFYKIENNSIVDASGFVEEVLKDDCMSFFQAKEAGLFDKLIEKQDGWLENEIKLSQNAFNIKELQFKNRNDVDYEAKLKSLFQEKQELSKFIGKYNDKYFLIENGGIAEVIDAPVLKDGWYYANDVIVTGIKETDAKRKELMLELDLKYENSKSVKIQNGHSFVISKIGDPNGYERFTKIIELSCETNNDDTIHVLDTINEIEGGGLAKYTINMYAIFWKYIFYGFYKQRQENGRAYNQIKAILTNQNATIEKLNSLKIDIPYPNGHSIIVDEYVSDIIEGIKIGEIKLTEQQKRAFESVITINSNGEKKISIIQKEVLI